jgi:hypothetical protein
MAARLPLDRVPRAWDRRLVPALTLRPAPLDRVAALRALPAVVIAVAGGAWLALVVSVAFGADLASGQAVWIAVAGSCACVSGLMVGAGGNVPGAAVLAVAALAAVMLAAGGGRETGPTLEARFPARAEEAPAATRDQAPGETRASAPAQKRDQAPAETRAQAPAPTGDLAPAQPAPVAPAMSVAAAGELVRSYYDAIDGGDFATAWERLSPAVQARFGGFGAWRDGYGTTVEQRVEGVEVQGDVIRYVLVATDRTPCGTATEQRFSVAWTIADGRAAALHAVKLAGQVPAAAC